MVRFGHIAGDRMLDLVNTVAWRLGGPERTESLTTYSDVVAWCLESDLIGTGEAAALRDLAEQDGAAAEREREQVVSAREMVYGVLLADDAEAAADLASLYRAAIAAADLVHTDGRWQWQDRETDLRLPRHRIVRGLVSLTQRDDLDRLHQCEDAKCGWVYLDTSPRRNRRWCDTKDCGDRNRARAYYARQKQKHKQQDTQAQEA
ncbi:CGNR zinc finger domain-containing protein [Streptomyces sp. R302]|uniref:CGNR zinc finger domain-containing protein n=1 Tax=unclassified Streptomyces TaxID=2593676 RepID=UPI00145E1D38|nr:MULTISPECIES: CGNR zinc finger domain-containing protein [unclassified Streptomyces]NML51713.1 CGNR zinc finger domain-containing protein [Streptomyces sp. R301]NML81333.1 CGNR zinc finger domain-containing protein [Streptomyces sp. R302]